MKRVRLRVFRGSPECSHLSVEMINRQIRVRLLVNNTLADKEIPFHRYIFNTLLTDLVAHRSGRYEG